MSESMCVRVRERGEERGGEGAKVDSHRFRRNTIFLCGSKYIDRGTTPCPV